MDQVSILSYVYLQKTASEEETLEGKDALERYAPDIGVTIKTYHADNIFFQAKKLVKACHKGDQGLIFAGVNAHHQK